MRVLCVLRVFVFVPCRFVLSPLPLFRVKMTVWSPTRPPSVRLGAAGTSRVAPAQQESASASPNPPVSAPALLVAEPALSPGARILGGTDATRHLSRP